MANLQHANLQKSKLRQQLRAKRLALSATQQQLAAIHLSRRIQKLTIFRQAQHIGFYLANDGEISPWPLLQVAHKHGKHCYLPALTSDTTMAFRRFTDLRHLVPNRFGILEPNQAAKTIDIQQLDLILLPLVGFDAHGRRLGMGGGYYDRSLAFKKMYKKLGPKLIGLAHAIQQVDALAVDIWDVPLDAIVTDKKLFKIY